MQFGKEPIKIEPTKIKSKSAVSMQYDEDGLNFSTTLPNKKSKYVEYANKSYFEDLEKLVKKSPTQWSIILKKIKLQVGDGLLFNNLNKEQSLNFLKANPQLSAWLKVNDYSNLIYNICYNWQVFGSICLKVQWDIDTHTKIVGVECINSKFIRSAFKNDQNVVEEYYYSERWGESQKNITIIPAFNESDKDNYTQLLYIKNGNHEYYGEPLYQHCLKSIEAEVNLEIYKNSIITKGYYPGVIVKFYDERELPEHEQRASMFKTMFGGAGNAGKAIILQSAGKEVATDVEPFNPADLDKQFTVTKDAVVQSILTANEITSSELMGIQVPGKLGTTDLGTAFELFNNWTVSFDRNIIEKIFIDIFNRNKYNITNFELQAFNPLGNIQTNNQNNINGDGNVVVESNKVNDLRNTVGGVTGILEIQNNVTAGITDYNSAKNILIIIYGFTEEEAIKLLGNVKEDQSKVEGGENA